MLTDIVSEIAHHPSMDKQVAQFREYVDRVMKETGLTPSEIAAAAGLAATTLTRPIYNPEIASAPTLRTINKIVQAVGIPFEAEGRVVAPSVIPPAEQPPTVILPPPGSNLPPINLSALPYDLPVYLLRASSLTVSEKLEGFMMQQDAAVEFCRRPPGLAGVANGYALYAPNDALNKFDQGELLVVAPDRPARPGDNVVVSVTAEGGEVVRFVGRLAARDRDGITLAVDRPEPIEERFAVAAVASVHKILNMAEALGI